MFMARSMLLDVYYGLHHASMPQTPHSVLGVHKFTYVHPRIGILSNSTTSSTNYVYGLCYAAARVLSIAPCQHATNQLAFAGTNKFTCRHHPTERFPEPNKSPTPTLFAASSMLLRV